MVAVVSHDNVPSVVEVADNAAVEPSSAVVAAAVVAVAAGGSRRSSPR